MIIVPLSVARTALASRPLDLQRRLLTAERPDPEVLQTVRDPLVSCFQSYVAERAGPSNLLQSPRGPLAVKFDERDILGWFSSFWDWFGSLRKHPWVEPPVEPLAIPEGARLALFSDWGTGLYGAPTIAKTIREQIKPDVAVNLGDTYYSGTPREQQENVLAFWPWAPINRCLNANHDMYSGGHGFFETLLPAIKQPASAFALENDRWLVIGLDTAYEDNQVVEAQLGWLQAVISKARKRRVMFLSHHQPWSAFELTSSRIRQLAGTFAVDTWYWGHEHQCIIYNQHPLNGTYGRCIGHGGFPYRRAELRPTFKDVGKGWRSFPPALDSYTGGILLDKAHDELGPRYGAHGFAVVTLGRSITEQVYSATGELLWETARNSRHH